MTKKKEKPPIKPEIVPRYTNRAGLCVLFGITDNALRGYTDKGLPKISRGVYDVQQVVKWYKLDKTLGTYHKTEEQKDATERLTLAKAIKQERENALVAEELVTWDRHLAVVGHIATSVNNAFESLGARIANQIASEDDPAKIQNFIWKESRETLQSIVDQVDGLDLSQYEKEI